MSTFEAKVEVVYDFLANRASLKRLTNAEEVARVAGYVLKARQERRIDDPVKRDKITKVLAAVDKKSLDEKGVLLSAVVAHFWDNGVSRHFDNRATKNGIKVAGTIRGEGVYGVEAYREQVFTAYTGSFPVRQALKPVQAPRRRIEDVFPSQARHDRTPTVERSDLSEGLSDFRERLAELADDFDSFANEYEGRHRRSEARV